MLKTMTNGKKLLKLEDASWIDVLSPVEYEQFTIPGAFYL
jgi:rhodanese-related sulfurtransferase